MSKRIIINVDDLGLSPAVNQGVLALAEQGRIQATSFMSLGQISSDEVIALQRLHIDIGLHFDLTGLAHQGSLKTILVKSYARRWSYSLLAALLSTQLDAFEHKMGAAPVFVDGHQHVHQFPQIRRVLLHVLAERYGVQQVAIRSTQSIQTDFKAKLIYALGGQALTGQLVAQHWRHNRAFGGVYGFDADEQQLAQIWQYWLSVASEQEITVLMCHPAQAQSGWQDDIKVAREREFAWLSSPAFARVWQAENCVAAHWRDVV